MLCGVFIIIHCFFVFYIFNFIKINFYIIKKEVNKLKWVEVIVHTAQEAVEAVSHILYEQGANGLVIEDPAELTKERENIFGELYALNPNDYPAFGVRVKAYFSENEQLITQIENIRTAIDTLRIHQLDVGEGTVVTQAIDEEDWAHAWKKYYHPVQVTNQITIVPSWEAYEQKHPDEKIIQLDPGMAFGTGTHPTTIMCLQGIEEFMQNGDVVIDVGTGTGVLAIAAAKLGAKEVFAYDLDEVAVQSAARNISANQVAKIVYVSKGDLLVNHHGQSNFIIGNLLAEIAVKLSPQTKKICTSGGIFLVSGIILEKQEMVCTQLQADDFEIIKIYQIKDWVAICARKRG